ncbi:vitamin B12 transporter [Muriicola jejuensis]|uniref:TonB-dependent receptor n=1 Tax=Muriicola jejuensis TaxID=504488 RepID=A0A6P0UCH2_9FLAO|nr:TonB-dependent receptor [Muriicola jejuensis]NER10981.1 TonB-dependent receptor [Muriicola jejuensis]SMP15090.1 vitamin B12 transporter [Muriicola jejuensis]
MTEKFWKTGVLLCIATGTWAQVPNTDSLQVRQLDEVVVSDTRFPIRRENSGKTVIRIGPEELALNQGRSLPELINTKSGIEISGSRGRAGEVLGAFVRGGRGRQLIVLIDGLRVSDPSSFSQEFDLRLLPLDNIASIEIIKGANSTLYGANAATAVINITTKGAPEKGLAASFRSSLGSNQTAEDQRYRLNAFENSARVAGTTARWVYSVGFGHRYTDGISSIRTETGETDPFSAWNTDLKLGYRISDKIRTQVYASQAKLNAAYDESFGLADAPYRFISEQERVGLNTTLSYKEGTMTLNLAYATYNSENFSAFPGTFEGKNLIGDLFNRVRLGNLLLLSGVNYNLELMEFEDTRRFSFVDPYVNLVYLGKKGLQLNAGGRLNLHSEYGSEFVYNLNPSLTLKREDGYLKFLGSFSTSFITPSLTQLFGQFGANPDLGPESNRTLELGSEYATSEIRASAVFFSRKEMDFVFFDNAAFQYRNAEDDTRASGVELELDWRPVGELSLEANYTFTERKGDPGIRIPKHKGYVSLGYRFSEPFSMAVSYAYTGARADTDFNTFSDVRLDAFSLVGMTMRYEAIPGKLTFFLQADNLLNASFTEVLGFNTRGRNVRAGFALNL